MNQTENTNFINQMWDNSIIPSLMRYIEIPNKSPQFDAHWQEHGYMERAIQLIHNWCQEQAVPGMQLEVIRLPHRTPLLLIEVPGEIDRTVLLYGHLDKQPEMTGWDEGLGPWKAVLRGDRLYGRGAADDGYAAFSALCAIKSLHAQNQPHARCIILIEACEESGSYDLPFYIDSLKKRIGHPDLIICLDSGCGNYEQLWVTTSLRGLFSGVLNIEVLKTGLHSGMAGGVVPSPFRIMRMLLERIEQRTSGELLKELHITIPQERIEQAHAAANVLQTSFLKDLPFLKDVQPESESVAELILRRTWYPAFTVTGVDGLPSIENGGNVMVPNLSIKLSFRLPPTSDASAAGKIIKAILEKEPPYQAKISFTIEDEGSGWNAPTQQAWLNQAIEQASLDYFGLPPVYLGEGASIPFMGMLGKKFPEAQFLITGVLGPGSNAHGPNEFLHLPTGKKLTACIAQVIANHYQQRERSL